MYSLNQRRLAISSPCEIVKIHHYELSRQHGAEPGTATSFIESVNSEDDGHSAVVRPSLLTPQCLNIVRQPLHCYFPSALRCRRAQGGKSKDSCPTLAARQSPLRLAYGATSTCTTLRPARENVEPIQLEISTASRCASSWNLQRMS